MSDEVRGCGYNTIGKDGCEQRCFYGDLWETINGKPQIKIDRCPVCNSQEQADSLLCRKYMYDWCRIITVWRMEKGFSTPSHIQSVSERDKMLGKLMLVVSEIAEASEAVRKANDDNFREELADTVIRIFDICGACDIDIEAEISKKMSVNKQRPMRHGKLTSL